MAEYTYNDIIIDPESEEAKNAIGKEVYYTNWPMDLLKFAIEDKGKGILTIASGLGFLVNDTFWQCIIVKKEDPKPKYVPFESAGEFTDAYDCANYSVKNGTVENKLLSYGGVWLKGKVSGFYYMVAEIRSDGVVLAGDQDVIFWSELLKDYVFIDGSPCGRLVEEKHE